MILSTHGIIGGAIGRLVSGNPIAAFSLGVISHFLTDAIPHWHYPLLSLKRDPENPINNDMVIGKKFLFDLAVIGFDFLLGFAVPILIFGFSPAVIAGALGGMLPDFFQFVYMKYRRFAPLNWLQRFHVWIHSKTLLDDRHFWGVSSQAAISYLAIFLSSLIS